MVNCPANGNITSSQGQANTLTAGIAVFLSALNIFLSITASLGNALILVALHKVSSVHPPTKLLFRCLAVTDLCVGLIVQPFFAFFILNTISKICGNTLFHAFTITNTSSAILCGVSVFTSTAISVDRLLALLLGLRYRHAVTLRRVRAVVICFWLISALGGSLYYFRFFRIFWPACVVCLILSVVISGFSYRKIFLTLRQHQAQVHDHLHQPQPSSGGEIPLNIARYKKTVSSIGWVQLAMVACYVPYTAVVLAVALHVGTSTAVVSDSALALVYLNSSLNPILYCWKIREVRQALKDTVKQCCCLSS